MIDRINNNKLCLGCGLCASVLPEKCKMQLDEDGFYSPKLQSQTTNEENKLIKNLCPGIHVEANKSMGIWGSMLCIKEAWSADATIRHKAASGGVVTSLAIYLVENKLVDAVLQVGVREDSYLYNELKVSRTKEDILKNAQSRYAPVPVFENIISILESSNETFAFVGKPCDMAAMQNLCKVKPQYHNRIKFYISIFCAGMPSYNATIKTWQQSGHKDEPTTLQYRGNGWPGNFCAEFSDGTNYQLTYNESWGKILGRSLGFRCKICPDGIGMLADIAIGDSWKTKDGYPDFTESDGRCFCMIRTKSGENIFNKACEDGYIQKEDLDISKIQIMQAYQYQRRKLEGWRLIPVQLKTGILLNFKGLSITKQALGANWIEGIKNLIGTTKRILRNGKR